MLVGRDIYERLIKGDELHVNRLMLDKGEVDVDPGESATFREYLNDYASPETREIGEKLIARELQEIENMPFFTDKKLLPTFRSYYDRIARGERDLYM